MRGARDEGARSFDDLGERALGEDGASDGAAPRVPEGDFAIGAAIVKSESFPISPEALVGERAA